MKHFEEIVGKRNDPAAVCAVRLEEAQKLLAAIEQEIKNYKQWGGGRPVDWGTVGTMSGVVRQLEETAGTLYIPIEGGQ